MKKAGTIKEFSAGGLSKPVFLHTAWGYQEVDHVRWPDTDPWAVCPKMNGGYGQSFAVTKDTPLFKEEK